MRELNDAGARSAGEQACFHGWMETTAICFPVRPYVRPHPYHIRFIPYTHRLHTSTAHKNQPSSSHSLDSFFSPYPGITCKHEATNAAPFLFGCNRESTHENEVSENTVFLSLCHYVIMMRDSAMFSIARYVTMPSPPPQMTLLTKGTGRNRKCWRNEVHDVLNDTPLRSIPGIKNKVEGAVVAAPLTDSEGQEGPDHKLGLRPTDRDRDLRRLVN